MKCALLDATRAELGDWIAERSHRAFHARQIWAWVFQRHAESFEEMTDLPRALRESLDDSWVIFGTQVVHRQFSVDGTDKLLLACTDDRRIECVLMAEDDRRTGCISTQVGCGMGCVFCASGLNGVERNLTRGEIVEQDGHGREPGEF